MNKKITKNLTVSIVTPVYNEIGTIDLFYSRLKKVLSRLKIGYEIIFVDDGSTDGSAEKIKQFAKKDGQVKAISFSRNFGHQIAITAGLDYCTGDAAITIDSDLQDPPELIPELVAKWQDGFDVVYAIRKKREDSHFKKMTAALFYRLFSALSEVGAPVDSGDFRLIDRKVINEITKFREKSRYLRGIVPWIGFRKTLVCFDRDERKTGKSKYSLKKMLLLSIDAVTAFSTAPLKLIAFLGLFITILSFVIAIYTSVSYLFNNFGLFEFQFLIAIVLFVGGLILIALGVLGEYVGRIYTETQDRPLYIVKEKINIENK